MQKQKQKLSANESNRNNQKKSSTQCNYQQWTTLSSFRHPFFSYFPFFYCFNKFSSHFCYISNQILCYGREDGIEKSTGNHRKLQENGSLKGLIFATQLNGWVFESWIDSTIIPLFGFAFFTHIHTFFFVMWKNQFRHPRSLSPFVVGWWQGMY